MKCNILINIWSETGIQSVSYSAEIWLASNQHYDTSRRYSFEHMSSELWNLRGFMIWSLIEYRNNHRGVLSVCETCHVVIVMRKKLDIWIKNFWSSKLWGRPGAIVIQMRCFIFKGTEMMLSPEQNRLSTNPRREVYTTKCLRSTSMAIVSAALDKDAKTTPPNKGTQTRRYMHEYIKPYSSC